MGEENQLDRLVIDTSSIISLCINDQLSELVQWHVQDGVTLYTCSEHLNEIWRALNYPNVKTALAFSPSTYFRILKEALNFIDIDVRFDRVPDENDNYLIDLAFTAKAYFLVTGDKDLLNMKRVNEIRIISITEWRRLLRIARSLK